MTRYEVAAALVGGVAGAAALTAFAVVSWNGWMHRDAWQPPEVPTPPRDTPSPWLEVTHFEDTEHQWLNTDTGERRQGGPIYPIRWP